MIANTKATLQGQLDRTQQVEDYAKSKAFGYTDRHLAFAMSPKCHDFKVYLDDVALGTEQGPFSEYRYYTEAELKRSYQLSYQGDEYGADADDIEDGQHCVMQLVRRFGWDLQNVGLVQRELDYIAWRMKNEPGFK